MTSREAVSSFRDMYPVEFTDDVLTGWVSELEGMIINEIVLTHDGAKDGASSFRGITQTEGFDSPLTASFPYDGVYADYLKMKCDEAHSDTVRYQSSSAIFGASYSNFADFYNRTHAPLGAGKLKTR
ncbi:MAG: hypothetical protein IKN38_03575 [Clostridia bacterium]|nr:hypothetical protein [Clostridia bacterium]